MATIKATNFASTTLQTGISASDLTANLAAGTGALFPTLGAGEYFYGVFEDTSGNREIVKVTARSVDAITMTRAQEGTTALVWAGGSVFELRPTVQTISDMVQQLGEEFPVNLTFTGTGNRITGDFSNATESSRVAIKTSTTNGKTIVPLYPDGTGTEVGFSAPSTPMTFYTGGSERMRIDTNGNVGIGVAANSSWGSNYKAVDLGILGSFLSNASSLTGLSFNLYQDNTSWRYRTTAGASAYTCGTGGLGAHSFYSAASGTADATATLLTLGGFSAAGAWTWNQPVVSGYGTGAGGTVTQATSRTTGVTLNKPTGAITLFGKSATAGLVDSFIVTNTLVAATDVIQLSFQSGTVDATDIYIPVVSQVSAGSFRVSIYTPAATANESPVLNFAIIKGAAS